MARSSVGRTVAVASSVAFLLAAPGPAAAAADPPSSAVKIFLTEAGGAAPEAGTVSERRDTVPEPRDTLPRYRTDDIAVTVTRVERQVGRVPYAVGALDVTAFREAERGASLAEALWRVPGIFAQDRRNFALGDRISARGVGSRAQFGVRGVRVLLDGIPLTLPDGQTTLENLDLAGIAGAEVIRGPAAALYGNAAAGVLSFRSQRPGPHAFQAVPRLTVGSYGWRETRLQASGRSDGLEYVAAATRITTDGFRDHADAEILRGTAILSRPLRGTRTAADPESRDTSRRGEIRALLNLYRSPWARNPGSLSLEDATERPRMAREAQVAQGTGKETNHAQAGLALDLPVALPLGSETGLRAAAWGVRREVWNPIPGTIVDLNRWSGGVRGELFGAATGLPLRWEVGVDLEAQWDDRVESANLGVPAAGEAAAADGNGDRPLEGERRVDQGERVVGIGPFVQLEVDVAPAWTATVAGRLDHYAFRATDRMPASTAGSGERTFTRFSPMAGLTWSPAEAVHLFANVTTAFQTPTTSELGNRPDGDGGFHPDLGPETILSYEAGARGGLAAPRIGYAVSAFTARVRDALIPFEGETGQVFFRNAGEVERRGVEVSATWLAGAGLRAELAYTRHHSRFERFETPAGDFAGNDEPGVPGHSLAAALLHRAPFGLESEARVRWVDAYAVNDANTASNPSHRVVDLRFAMPRGIAGGAFRPFLGVDNLFDERFNGSVVPNAFGGRYYEPAPGVELYGGLEVALPRRGAGRPAPARRDGGRPVPARQDGG